MIPYILHVALLISVCLIFYKVLLQKETFYRLNRVVLVVCLALSFALPLVPVPPQWAFRESPKPAPASTTLAAAGQAAVSQERTNDIRKQLLVNAADAAAINQKSTVVNATPAATLQPTSAPAAEVTPLIQRIVKWLFYLYWIGVTAFGLNLLIQIVALLYQAYTKPVIRDGKFRIIELSGDKAPCSFGNNIFINPEKYDWDTYSQILLHEKIHIQQGHSFDILIAELVLVLQWFNPFAWLYRTELESNLEFLTDNAVLEHKEIERSSYQMSLLKVSAPHLSLGITTNYNQSLLKRRIVMMNAKKSNIHIMWKYFFLVPLLGVLACALNDPAAFSKPLSRPAEKHSGLAKQWWINTNTEGTWFATIKNDRVRMEFRSDSDDHNWSSNSDFKLSEFSSLPRDKKGDFTLTREAGTVLFNGKFDGNQGYGHYKFMPNSEFKDFLGRHGITGLETGDEFAYFMINIKKDYVQMLESNGYKNLSKNDLISMGALKVDEPYIRFWKAEGYPNLTPNELVSGKALGITAAYVDEIHKAGYPHLSFNQLISFKATGVTGKYISGLHNTNARIGKPGKVASPMPAEDVISVKALNVDANYINSMQKEGYSNLPAHELTSMKAVGVTPQYIAELRGAGYKNLSANDLVSLKSMSITPAYARAFEADGYKNIPAHELISMKSVGVTHEFIAELRAAGYKNVPVNDLVSLRALGITPEFSKSFESVGYKNIPYRELTSIKAMGITPEYIKSFQDLGYKNVPINTFSSVKAMSVTPEFIDGFKKIGYDNISLNEATSLKANGITPDYVKEMRDKGFKSQDLNKYIELKHAFN